MPTPHSSLTALPEELLVTILSHLSTPTNHPTLCALSLTNTLLHRLILPILYHRFPGSNSELLLRTISHSPNLGQHIKSTTWRPSRKRRIPRIDILEKTHIVRRLNQLAVPQQGTDLAEQFAKYGPHNEYWFMEVLLLFMPAVEEVEVVDSWLWDDHHYWFKSLSSFFNPLCECTLKKAVLHGPLRVENVVPLLTIATLRMLECTQVVVMRREGWRVFQWSIWPLERVLPERSAGLESLSLRESCVDLDTLVLVMRGIRALKSFVYEHEPNELAVPNAALASPMYDEGLAACIALQRESLEVLRIRSSEAFSSSEVCELFGSSASASSHTQQLAMERLQTLDIGPFTPPWEPGVHAWEVDALAAAFPPSLTTLRIKIDSSVAAESDSLRTQLTEILTAFLILFAARMPTLRPDLRVVELVDWDPLIGWFPESLASLQDVFWRAGMRLGAHCGDAVELYGAEPLLQEEVEGGEWILVTGLISSSTF